MGIVQLSMFDCKRCTVCGVVKHMENFNKRASTSDGVDYRCRDCGIRASHEYYGKNKQRILDELKKEYATNPKRRTYNQEYRRNNPDKMRKYKQTDAQRHPESLKRNRAAVAHRRRVRIYSGIGRYTAEQWKQLCEWFGSVCLCCGTNDKLTVDHVIPLVKSGRNDIANLQCLCSTCNKKKNARTIDYRDPDQLAAFLEHTQC